MAQNCHKDIGRLQRQFLVLLTLFILPAYSASFREEPSSKEVSIGDDVTLRCSIDGNLESVSVFWWNINTARAFSDNDRSSVSFLSVDQIERFSITGNSTIGEFHFSISDVKYADAGTYSCRFWDGIGWHFSQEVSVSVVRQTPDCTLALKANLPVDVGDIVRLSCRSYSNDPNVQLHWFRKGRVIQSLPNLSTNTLLVTQLTLTESDYDVPFLCLQVTEDQRKACQLVPLHRQISVAVLNRITTAYEGDTATFQCTTGFSKDSLSFSWFVDDVLQPQSTASLELIVTAQNNGSRITCKVQDSVSGIAGENDALLIVAPRPDTPPPDITTRSIFSKATTLAVSEATTTEPTKLQSNPSKTSTMITDKLIPTTSNNKTTKPSDVIEKYSTYKLIPTTSNNKTTKPSDVIEKYSTSQVESFSNTELASGIVSSLLVCIIIIIIVVVVIVVRRRRQNSRFDTTGHQGGNTRKDNEQILMESHVSTHKKKGEATPGAHSPIPDTNVAMTNEDKNEECLIPIDGEAQGQEYEDPDIAVEEDSWEISWEKLMLGTTILGKGNFGEVREGVVWKNEEKVVKVAVKCLKDGASLADEKDFRDELETMKKVGNHPNIVTLIGSCIHEGILYVALELIEHGNLRSFLRQVRKDGSYTQWLDQLMTFAVNVASGMRYLTNIGVIHRDLAARNVLLGNNYVAKVSDFGLSRDEDIYVQKSKTRIPVRWMPPESIRFQRYTSKSDVWSFGVLLWEIGALGGTPYAGIASKELGLKLKDGYRMPKPDKCSDDMYEVMTSCWQFDPDLRPTFRELHRTLSRMLDDNQIYMRFEVYENVKLSPINTDRDDC